MGFPGFYKPERVGDLYDIDIIEVTNLGRAAGLAPAALDKKRILLLLVDVQIDFVHPDGTLHVPGAVEDTRRTVEWIYRNVGSITKIAASLDSHTPIQIFSPTWWVGENNQHPVPYTVITVDDVNRGKWKPLYETDWSKEYVKILEHESKKQLMIWPFHTLIGTRGHNLMPSLYEAIAYHSAARQSRPDMITKGTIAKTEFYSMLEPEVKIPDHPLGTINRKLLDEMGTFDRIYITGQAKSHCVLETGQSIMRYFADRPGILDKIYLLEDGTSPVQHPEIDFDALANEGFSKFEEQGMHRTTTTAGI